MAQKGVQLDQEAFSCSICLDLLTDPVTIPCGHSYCMNCIKSHWGGKNRRKICSCPECRQNFRPRPVLVKNTMLAVLVEELKKTRDESPAVAAAPDDQCYAGPDDVACDVCTGRKLKAVKSCLQCVASYCESHIQPHYDAPPLKKHKRIDPTEKLQENICVRHIELMKMFCRTDQQCICYLCSVEDHKGHDTVTISAERTELQRELEVNRQKIQERIQKKEKDVNILLQEIDAISRSAEVAVENSGKMFTDLIRVLQKRRSDVKQQIRSQQETEVSRVKELQEKLEQELTELRRKDTELEKLSVHLDDIHFLQNYPSLSKLSDATNSSTNKIHHLHYFEDVTAAMSDLRDKLQHTLSEEWTNISLTVTQVDVLLPNPEPEPKTRAEFLKYSCDITLDPDTVNAYLSLSDEGKTAKFMNEEQDYAQHPHRFSDWYQVLSKESLTGRCYWEVEWNGRGFRVAVTYKNIKRYGPSALCGFGNNDKSWALYCGNSMNYEFRYNNVSSPVSGPCSSRIGVYLDHRAGVLSFYSISKSMTLLHRVHTTFTQPLYVGLWLYSVGDFSKLK